MSLKRLIPYGRQLYELREHVRRRVALLRARREARAVVAAVRRFKSMHPGRPVYGILLVEHLGDIIASEPVIGWARRQSADAIVVWVIKSAYAELMRDHPGVDLLLTVESLASIAPIVRSAAFDVTVDLHINRKPTGIGDVVHTKTWGDPTVNFDTYLAEGSLLRALTKAAGIEQFGAAAELHVSSATRSAVDALELPSRFIVVHATSNDPARDWPVHEWLGLLDYVVAKSGLPVVEVGLQAVLSPRSSSVSSLCGRLSIMETAEVIRRASFFFGVDSGPAHMANAFRRPSLILVGQFRGHDWCPYEGYFTERDHERVLRHPAPVASLSVAQVIERLSRDPLWSRVLNETTSYSLQNE